jgi:hypothetical protein
MYKFIFPDTKRKQNIFWVFLKYWPSFHGFNKLVIKVKMHAEHLFFLNFCCMKIRYDLFFLKKSLRDLAICMKTRYFFRFIIFLQCFDENQVF